MKAAQIMTSPVVTVGPRTPARDAIALLAEHEVTSLPVVDEDASVIGIVSEVDLLRSRARLLPHPHARVPACTVRDVMSDVVVCLSENADAADLADVLVDNRIRAVPILRGADLVGIVSRRDVLRALAAE